MAVIKYELYPKPHKLSHFVALHCTVCNKNEWRSSKWQEKGPKNLRILHCRPFFSERNVKQTQTSCNSVLTHFFSALISFESLFAIFFSGYIIVTSYGFYQHDFTQFSLQVHDLLINFKLPYLVSIPLIILCIKQQ